MTTTSATPVHSNGSVTTTNGENRDDGRSTASSLRVVPLDAMAHQCLQLRPGPPPSSRSNKDYLSTDGWMRLIDFERQLQQRVVLASSFIQHDATGSLSLLGLDALSTGTDATTVHQTETLIHVDYWHSAQELGGDNDDTLIAASSLPPPPHAAWTRRRITTTSLLPHDSLSGSERKHTIHWIFLDQVANSAFSNNVLSTRGAVCRFLRAILPERHPASPWQQLQPQDSKEDGFDDGTSLPVDCVIVSWTGMVVPDVVLDFRVADACPSWYLHNILQLQSTSSSSSSSNAPMLLVYRRLKPRAHLSLTHFETGQLPSMNGCLWERYRVRTPQEDDTEPLSEPVWSIRQVSPPLHNALDEYPALQKLVEPTTLALLRRDAQSIAHWTAWPEQQHYQASENGHEGPTWTVFPLCHCFPATQVEKRQWIAPTSQHVPSTVQVLQKVLGDSLRTALFSRLKADSVLEAHTGWYVQ